jgi:lipopolysaccharide transport system ATP-binding protein
MNDEVLVKVENVSKKFCRSLKRSLWYGMQDMLSELNPFSHRSIGTPYSRDSASDRLRPDEFWAVKDVSFELRRGECLGLIGRNGAGKTTLLKMLNGLIKPDQGRITMRGQVGALIALGAGFNPILTGRENIYVNGSVLGLTKKSIDDKIEEIIDFAELRDFIDTPVQSYSSGMQVRLGFAVATALRPDVLLLDEVLAVGDTAFRVKCFNRMYEMLENASVIFVSHNMSQISRICDRLLLLENGRPILFSTDLGKVIHRYFEDNAFDYAPQLQGSGKTTIHRIAVRDQQDREVDTIESAKPFSIAVALTVPADEAYRDTRILLTINNEEQNSVAQLYERIEHLPYCKVKDGTLLEMRLDSACFNPGKYWITASIQLGKRGEMGCVLRNACAFTVSGDYVGYAPVLLRPYTLEPQARS